MPASVNTSGHCCVMRTSVRMNNLAIEWSWLDRGATLIAGTDEVGRGAWAGPVVAGMVAVPQSFTNLCQSNCMALTIPSFLVRSSARRSHPVSWRTSPHGA